MDVKNRKTSKKVARRAAVTKSRKRRLRKYTLYYLTFIVFAAAAGIALSLTVFFKIENISVTGNSKYADGDIVAASGIEKGQNLFRIDPADAKQSIESIFPYVETARVRRVFPSGVNIEISQAKPQAALKYSGGYMLITLSGKVLETSLESLPSGFIQIVGVDPGELEPGKFLPDSFKEQLTMLGYLEQAFDEVPLEQEVNLIDLSDRLDIKILFQKRIILRLGSEGDLVEKLTFAKAIISEHLGDNFVGVLNAAETPQTARYGDIFSSAIWPFGDELLNEYSPAPPPDESEQGHLEEIQEGSGDESGEEEAPSENQVQDGGTPAA